MQDTPTPDDLLDAVRDLPKVMPYLHVPAQSGCDAVLKAMADPTRLRLLQELQPDDLAVVPDRAVQAGHLETHVAECDRPSDPGLATSLAHLFLLVPDQPVRSAATGVVG